MVKVETSGSRPPLSSPTADADLSDQAIGALIAQHRPGWSLAQPFYNSPRIFERDVQKIFLKEWLFVDHASRIPRPGDYFLFAIAGESLIIVRDQDGQIHALFNVCRHRGSRVCLQASGSAKALVCPYHAWSYGLDGRLLGAQAMGPDFDRTQYGLRRGSIRLVEGLIFLCLSEEPPNAESSFQTWERYLRPHGLASAKIAHRILWRIKANWKLVMENYRECYHCGPAHPEYTATMAHAAPESTGSALLAQKYDQLLKSWTERAKALGSMTEHSSEAKDRLYAWKPGERDLPVGCSRIPIKEGFLTQSPDGQPVAPLMGDYRAYDGGLTSGRLDPVNFFTASCDHAVLPRFTPIDAVTTEVEMIWLVRADAVENVDYQLDRLTWLWQVTTDQDSKIVEDNQAGVNSRAYVPGPYAEVEGGPRRFTLSYLRRLAGD